MKVYLIHVQISYYWRKMFSKNWKSINPNSEISYQKSKSFQIPDYRNAIIVARNPNSVKRATSYAERLRLGIAVIHGEEKYDDEDKEDDGRNSPPLCRVEYKKIEILPGLYHWFKVNSSLGWKLFIFSQFQLSIL